MKRIIIAGLLLVGVMSCSVENEVPANYDNEGIKTLDIGLLNSTLQCGETVEYPFGSFSVGKVVLSKDDTNLYVDIIAATPGDYVQSRVQFFELDDPNFPRTPSVGHIDNWWHWEMDKNKDGHHYIFPLTDFECGPYRMIAWAPFRSGGSLANHFAGDYKGEKGKWNYLIYCIEACQDDPPQLEICDTAFMATGSTLSGFYREKNANNWGWYLKSTDISDDSGAFDIYAGAGQNILSKGEKVGTVTVFKKACEIDGDQYGYGDYKIDLLDNYSISELHAFKNTGLPQKRQAPGLYRDCQEPKDETNSTCFSQGDPFYLIIHMKVCWFEDAPLN